MRFRLELMQLEIGISTNRYLPASGTAGLERSFVSGNRREPAPPPIITASTLTVFGADRLPCPISPPPSLSFIASKRKPRHGCLHDWRDWFVFMLHSAWQ